MKALSVHFYKESSYLDTTCTARTAKRIQYHDLPILKIKYKNINKNMLI